MSKWEQILGKRSASLERFAVIQEDKLMRRYNKDIGKYRIRLKVLHKRMRLSERRSGELARALLEIRRTN